MSKIGTIRIKGVRGIRSELEIGLETNQEKGCSLLVRGDNGTGKSSIVQALRWSLLGQLTSPSSPAIPPEFQRHLLETDEGASEIEISLHPKGRIVMKGGAVDASLTDAEGQAYLAACRRSSPFLRRDELLGFLTDTPGERFKYLERFLELDAVDKLLSSLVPVAKGHESKAADARDRVAHAVDKVCVGLSLGGGSPATVTELLSALHAEAKRLGIVAAGVGGTFEALEAIRAGLPKTKTDAAAAQRRAQLSSALERAMGLAPPDHPRTVLDPLREAEQRAQETDLAELLTQAAEAVERHPARETCPVCEQSVSPPALAERLRARLAQLAEVRQLTDRANTLGAAWAGFLKNLDELEAIANAAPRERSAMATQRLLLEELIASDADTLSARTLARLEALRQKLATARDAIPDELRASELAKLASAIDAALAARPTLEDTEREAETHAKRAKELRAIEKAVSGARKVVVDSTMKDIESLVTDFYERVHPPNASDEVTGAPKIKIKGHGSGTAHVLGMFNRSEVRDPLYVYSDGHLDTVGICIFLALRKRSSTGPKLLVLDDIVLSIDLGHADRLVKLLRDEFKDHQILLFSHNELFMRMCRTPFSQAKQLNIVRWSLDDGPQLSGHVPPLERLEERLRTCGDAEELATAMRPVLDALLEEAADAFEVALPKTSRRGLTMAEYWSQLRPALLKLSKAGLLPDLTRTLEDIGEPNFFRNALGAHRNEWAFEAPLGQVQRVAKGVLELARTLTCVTCKRIAYLLDARDLGKGFGCDCPRSAGGPSLPHHASQSETAR